MSCKYIIRHKDGEPCSVSIFSTEQVQLVYNESRGASRDWKCGHGMMKAFFVAVTVLMALAAGVSLVFVGVYVHSLVWCDGASRLSLDQGVEGTVLCGLLIIGALVLFLSAAHLLARCLADMASAERDVMIGRDEHAARYRSTVLEELLRRD